MEGIEIELYETVNGKQPFEIWIKDIKEIHTRAKILTRLDRLRLGTSAIAKPYKKGFASLEFITDPDYYGKIGNKVILLLCGGDKSSQERDIAKAKDYQLRELDHGKK
ncbi:Uncharacterized protein DB42_BD00270 [Neochlamydia sp. EPS4]|uniref:type II toxin-antitoxin system RelE/ParE family toxin n=1 Tax=Neochlamydia sp. EPS4 TaxID=1478175 RepID=UPI0005831347|nr:type II toxin-antitoxin system RelE/ParE family toxin [Neochlamydia sp. EPS4]KIC74479.1 Uncharacterized protein DB42_BD00270 [Neochlamydia sp. EPS4]